MIDERAVVDPSAKIADDVTIGPFSVIGPDVEIGRGTWVGPHVVINGPTRIGCDNKIFQFSSIGEECQDLKYANEPTRLEIGDRNVIREFVTMHRGTIQDEGLTKVGDDNLFMAYVHLAHDCVVGNRTIFANAASLAGHVQVGDQVILGGFTKVHQFCHIGSHAFTALGTTLLKSIPPYVVVSGNPGKPHGVNSEGLKRRGFDAQAVRNIRSAYKTLYKSGLRLEEAIEKLQADYADDVQVKPFVEFLQQNSGRGFVR